MESESKNAADISLKLELVDISQALSETLMQAVRENVIDITIYPHCISEILCYMVSCHLTRFQKENERKEILENIIERVKKLVGGYEKESKKRKQKLN